MAPLAEPIEYEIDCPNCEWTATALHHNSEGLEEARARLLELHQEMFHSETEEVIPGSGELRP